jgi:hypothetical protein
LSGREEEVGMVLLTLQNSFNYNAERVVGNGSFGVVF